MAALDPLQMPLHFGAILDELGLNYAVGGSWASTSFGSPRSTYDADFVVDLNAENAPAFLAAVAQDFYVAQDALASAVELGGALNIIHFDTAFQIVIFVAADKPFNEAPLARRVRDPRDYPAGGDLWLVSPEDIALAKLDWYRRGGGVSERQWRDPLGVMKVQGDALDKTYLLEWAAHLGVLELLELAYVSLD